MGLFDKILELQASIENAVESLQEKLNQTASSSHETHEHHEMETIDENDLDWAKIRASHLALLGENQEDDGEEDEDEEE